MKTSKFRITLHIFRSYAVCVTMPYQSDSSASEVLLKSLWASAHVILFGGQFRPERCRRQHFDTPTCHPQQHDSCKLVATWQYEIRYSSTSLSLMAEVFFGGNNTIISLPHIYGDHTSFEVQCLFITMSSEAVEFPTQASLVKCTVIKLTSNCAGVL